MGIFIIFIVIFFAFVWLIEPNKSTLTKLKEALKDTKTSELELLNELITDELNKRNKK